MEKKTIYTTNDDTDFVLKSMKILDILSLYYQYNCIKGSSGHLTTP